MIKLNYNRTLNLWVAEIEFKACELQQTSEAAIQEALQAIVSECARYADQFVVPLFAVGEMLPQPEPAESAAQDTYPRECRHCDRQIAGPEHFTNVECEFLQMLHGERIEQEPKETTDV